MHRSAKGALGFGALAALFWSRHFYAVQALHAAGEDPFVLQFYFVLGAAVGLLLLLFLAGRVTELADFSRRDTHLFALAATGGYGVWLLSSLALESLSPGRALLLSYAVPLWIGAFSLFAREKADGRIIGGLLLGFVGCYLVARGEQWAGAGAATGRGTVFALGAAACWALFSLQARSTMQQQKALPAAAAVLGIGAVCLFITSLSMGMSIFRIEPAHLFKAMLTGLFTVGVATVLWLKCLAGASAALASPFWYLGMVFGLWWASRAPGVEVSFWWALGGTVLVLWSGWTAVSGRDRQRLSMGDVIRGEF